MRSESNYMWAFLPALAKGGERIIAESWNDSAALLYVLPSAPFSYFYTSSSVQGYLSVC